MGRIRILPDALVNRIAAGEVVERPASAVKELVENALDAAAASIVVRIDEGGRKLAEVSDDGSGMDADDAVAAMDRHATSKLAAGSSLEKIETLGFRGEAIPSIAAVSRFTLVTSDGGPGTRVDVEGGRLLGTRPAPHPKGTTVSVRDLFFNTPARRRFLRAPSTELGHIVEIFLSLALSRPAVRFRLDHGKRRLFDLPGAADLAGRLAQVEGPEAARGACLLDEAVGGVRLSGYIVRADETGQASRASRRLVVNGRVVKDRLLARAAARGLEDALPSGARAACLVVLEMPPAMLDINVHPAKAEVRFTDPGHIHDLVYGGIGRALGASRPPRAVPEPSGARPATAVFNTGGGQGAVAGAVAAYMPLRPDVFPRPPWAPSSITAATEEDAVELGPEVPEVIGHYRSGYILAADDRGLLIVDQHAAHERILFEEMTGPPDAGAVQPLLLTRTVDLPAALRGRAADVTADLVKLGFEVEPFGEETLLVRAVPAPLAGTDAAALVSSILSIEGEEVGARAGLEERRRRMLASAACHAAVKVPEHLTREKLGYILERLVACRTPLKCPHGRPTVLRWDHRALERRFGRP